MADEIAQVVEMEYKGVYYLFKGTKDVIAMMARMVKALHAWKNKKYLEKPGNCSWEKLQKVSNGTPPILEFPKEMFEEKVIKVNSDGSVVKKSDFDLYCEKYDLRYCIMPDLNPNDDYIPVAVPSQDMGIHEEQIKAVMGRRIKSEEEKVSEYDSKIRDMQEKILNTPNEKEKAKLEAELTMLKEGKEQSEMLLSESKEKLEKDNVLDFAEYLKQGKGTLAEYDPQTALNEENVCGIVREYTPYECMWPVRDAGLVPEDKELFYTQRTSDDQIHVIRRQFVIDEQGRIYSKYYYKALGTGSEKMVSDFGLSKKEWERKLPEMLKEGGFINEEKTAVVQGKERFFKYREFIEENFKKAQAAESDIKDKTYSSEEAKAFVEGHNKETKQRAAYEDSMFTIVTVPSEKIMADGEGIMCLELAEGLLSGVALESMDDKEARCFINAEANYSVVKSDGSKFEMKGEDIIKESSNQAESINAKSQTRKGR